MSTIQNTALQRKRFKPGRSRRGRAWKALSRAPLSAWFGIVVVLTYAGTALFAPQLAPYGEAQVFPEPFAPWSADFVLGTDQLGRDVLTRLIYGARNTLGIAVITTTLSFFFGVSLGVTAALLKGWVDQALSRSVDIVLSIPGLIFSLMLLAIFGSNVWSLILIIAVLDSTNFYRLARTSGLSVASMEFIEAARLRGERPTWIVFREILPNILPPLIAEAGLRFCFVFLTISALSFLGVGIQPPTADWGSMVRENATLITYGDITPLLPAAAIGLLTVAVNFVVDWFLTNLSGIKDGH
ncbi:binding-protein-dependent transport systems inner membrane component (plasmid) [Rhizobium leguminosarum bv. trifolii WSM2304]|uniref:Binding-protein-dependent transport systems inner membrane component n=1 Tax=Rhizobium leguminosarum bv. trifolii (strain WSM2304) TaxID=395492 RepID=A0ABF7QZM7_RHILW|nr:ABC transporter permease [Rhizobium leguminosarum]ACI59695.1 binding-protein-dependent transport systems inner membrane component [Rhizobium leguminosarum bv. trifolii WSM2304]